MTGLTEHPPTDRHDESALFGNWDEFCRRHESEVRMPPTDERLDPDDCARLQVNLGLVVQHQFLSLQGVAQAILQRLPLESTYVQFLLEKLAVVPPVSLGVVHGKIRVLHQCL